MTGTGTLFLVLSISCAVIGLVLMMAMVGALRTRGHRINWVFLRLYMFKYISQYRKVTLRESGRTGPLFYPFIVSMNSALLFAILGLVLGSR